MLCRNCCTLINNTINHLLLRKAGDLQQCPFPCDLKHADKAAWLWCANTRTTIRVCFAYCPVTVHPSQRGKCHSVGSLEWHWKSSSSPRASPWCPAAPRTTHGCALCPQSFSNHLACQEHKGKPKDSLKLGYVSLDGLTQQPSDLTGAFATSPFKRKHRPLRVKTPGFTSPLQHQLTLWTWAC